MKSLRVLLADDHTILREGVRLLLSRSAGAPRLDVVAEAGSGPEALALAGQARPDVAVVDLALPGLHGLDVCRRLRAAGTPVVVLTMHVSAEHVRRAREAGAGAYVVKGSGVAQLASAIRAVAEGRQGPFPEAPPDPLAGLTPREREVLVEVARGASNREIAARLGVSIHTVNTHRVNVMEKLGVHDAVGLGRLAVSLGLLA